MRRLMGGLIVALGLVGCRTPMPPPAHEPADETVSACVAMKRWLGEGGAREARPGLAPVSADLAGLRPGQVDLLLGRPWKKHGTRVWEYRPPCWGTCCGVVAVAWADGRVLEVFDSPGFEAGFGGEAVRYGEFLARHDVPEK